MTKLILRLPVRPARLTMCTHLRAVRGRRAGCAAARAAAWRRTALARHAGTGPNGWPSCVRAVAVGGQRPGCPRPVLVRGPAPHRVAFVPAMYSATFRSTKRNRATLLLISVPYGAAAAGATAAAVQQSTSASAASPGRRCGCCGAGARVALLLCTATLVRAGVLLLLLVGAELMVVLLLVLLHAAARPAAVSCAWLGPTAPAALRAPLHAALECCGWLQLQPMSAPMLAGSLRCHRAAVWPGGGGALPAGCGGSSAPRGRRFSDAAQPRLRVRCSSSRVSCGIRIVSHSRNHAISTGGPEARERERQHPGPG